MKTLIKNASLVNEGEIYVANVIIQDDVILKISRKEESGHFDEVIDATGLLLFPGVIDDQVHFRDPGLTTKGDIFSESRAAAAGGITSFMDMPNTIPQTTTMEALHNKHIIAAHSSLINYSFYLGATNDNTAEIEKTDPLIVCGIKMFMGSSTGNMLVHSNEAVSAVFAHAPVLVAVHCEEDSIISRNLAKYKALYGDNIPMHHHADIRSEEACYASSARAVELATKHNARLHILHLSTEKEISLMQQIPLNKKTITGEVCVHHLWFSKNDYNRLGSRIKWNPSIKTENDRLSLIQGLNSGYIDIVATDHAPHTIAEKLSHYSQCPSGAPMVQHSLVVMLEMAAKHNFSYQQVADYMCHKPAALFQIQKRGYIRESYYADLVLVNPNAPTTVSPGNILYKCGWSPLENQTFSHGIVSTWVNGKKVFDKGKIIEVQAAMPLRFER